MKFERQQPATGPIVAGFGPGGFRVGELHYPAVLLTVDQAIPWDPPALAMLEADAIEPALSPVPEFMLLGTGSGLVRPPAALARVLEARGIGLEPMDSRAAARAWGVLRSEGRRIAAALYPLG